MDVTDGSLCESCCLRCMLHDCHPVDGRLAAFSFSKKARTFSTICLVCDLSRSFSLVFGLLCVAVSCWSYRLPQWTFFLDPFLRIMYNYWGEPERAPHLSYCCAKSSLYIYACHSTVVQYGPAKGPFKRAMCKRRNGQ